MNTLEKWKNILNILLENRIIGSYFFHCCNCTVRILRLDSYHIGIPNLFSIMAKGHVGIQIKSYGKRARWYTNKILSTIRKVKLLNHTVKTAESSQLLWDAFTVCIVLIRILLASLQLENVKVKSRWFACFPPVVGPFQLGLLNKTYTNIFIQ